MALEDNKQCGVKLSDDELENVVGGCSLAGSSASGETDDENIFSYDDVANRKVRFYTGNRGDKLYEGVVIAEAKDPYYSSVIILMSDNSTLEVLLTQIMEII